MRNQSNTVALICLLILVLIAIMGWVSGASLKYRQQLIDFLKQKNYLAFKPSLEQTVTKALEGTQGTYSIAIKNLKTGESYYLEADKQYGAGSLYKLWVMATVFEKINKGELNEDEILSQDIKTLNEEFELSDDEAELTDGTITLSVTEALRQMISISHNYAALLLTEKVKVSSLKAFLSDYGFKNSVLDPPKTTASDITLFFEKLYQGEITSNDSSQKMIGFLKDQKLNGGIPKYLPDKSKVANKTGDIGWFKHDGGIVFTDKGDYIIVILSESNAPSETQERIALISKAVYDYFITAL